MWVTEGIRSCLEVSILTLHWPQYFLPLSALGGAFSRLSGNCGASCRPKIYETFAKVSNLGDIMRPGGP